MSADLLDRLIADVFATTQTLMDADAVDLQAYQPSSSSIEKQHANQGLDHKDSHKAKRPMHKGVHRTVC